jgi:hypothetical protein
MTTSDLTADDLHPFFVDKGARVRNSTDGASDAVYRQASHDIAFGNFWPVERDDVIKHITALPDKQCACDPMPTWLLKVCACDHGDIGALAPLDCSAAFNYVDKTSCFASSVSRSMSVALCYIVCLFVCLFVACFTAHQHLGHIGPTLVVDKKYIRREIAISRLLRHAGLGRGSILPTRCQAGNLLRFVSTSKAAVHSIRRSTI